MNFDDNVTLLNIANSVADTGSNFLPAGTVITVGLNGSEDFTTLEDAVEFLTGKYSNGKVTILLEDGEYIIDNQIIIDGDKFNINKLIISGTSEQNTILKFNGTVAWVPIIRINSANVDIKNLTCFSTVGQPKTSNYGGISYTFYSTGRLSHVTCQNCGDGILSTSMSKVILDNFTAIGCSAAITAINGSIWIDDLTVLNINNCGTGFNSIVNGSIVSRDHNNHTITNTNQNQYKNFDSVIVII